MVRVRVRVRVRVSGKAFFLASWKRSLSAEVGP